MDISSHVSCSLPKLVLKSDQTQELKALFLGEFLTSAYDSTETNHLPLFIYIYTRLHDIQDA